MFVLGTAFIIWMYWYQFDKLGMGLMGLLPPNQAVGQVFGWIVFVLMLIGAEVHRSKEYEYPKTMWPSIILVGLDWLLRIGYYAMTHLETAYLLGAFVVCLLAWLLLARFTDYSPFFSDLDEGVAEYAEEDKGKVMIRNLVTKPAFACFYPWFLIVTAIYATSVEVAKGHEMVLFGDACKVLFGIHEYGQMNYLNVAEWSWQGKAWLALAVILTIRVIFARKKDVFVTFAAVGTLLTGIQLFYELRSAVLVNIPIIFGILELVLQLIVCAWAVLLVPVGLFPWIFPFMVAAHKTAEDVGAVVNSVVLGSDTSSADSSPASFSFPSAAHHNGQTYDLQEVRGSNAVYRNRATGEYRNFSNYEFGKGTSTRPDND